MTIITIPSIGDKKEVKEALVVNDEPLPLVDEDKLDLEAAAATPTVVQSRRARRVNNAATLCVFITALLVMTVGTLCGIHLYKQYAKSKIYHSSIDLPIDHLLHEARTSGSTVDDNLPKNGMIFRKHNYRLPLSLHEEFHIDLESQVYERIFVPRVPEFIRGRRGQFIHDFMQNKTGIVDIDGRRCFVMPLDRTRILPPRNLFDLLMKLKAGYYKVDTKMVQLTMRVVQPPIVNYKSLGYYIARECVGFPTYKLEKMTSAYADFNQHVYKRSVKEDTNVSNFVEYAGSLIQYRILNIEDAKHTR